MYGPYPYEAVYGVDEQCWGVREEGNKEQRDEEINFTKEDLRSVEAIIRGEVQEALRRVIWRDYAGDLNLYTIPQHERELMYISALLLRWYRNTAEHEREQMGEDKWWEGVENAGLTCMHLKVTDKRQGKDDKVYIFECKDTTQRLVDIVDRVLSENNIVVWGGRPTSSSGQHGDLRPR